MFPQNLMFVRPSVRPCVSVRHAFFGSIHDLSQFDVITPILRNLRETIYTEGSKGGVLQMDFCQVRSHVVMFIYTMPLCSDIISWIQANRRKI